MAKVKAGPAPWSSGYKALAAKSRNAGFIPGRGWRKNVPDEWDRQPAKVKFKTVRNPLTGRSMKVPMQDISDYIQMMNNGAPDDQVLQFSAERGLDIESGMAAYVEEAFDKKHKHYSIDGCGHIKMLEYNVRRQVMRVSFVNNDSVCVFFRVPTSVFGELYHLAQTKVESRNTFDSKVRHVLGIRFWDLVRIRGTKSGSRFRFTYSSGGPTGGSAGRPREYEVVETLTEYKSGKKKGQFRKVRVPIKAQSVTDERLLKEMSVQAESHDILEKYTSDTLETFFEDGYYEKMIEQINAMPTGNNKEQAGRLAKKAKQQYDSAADDYAVIDTFDLLANVGVKFPDATQL